MAEPETPKADPQKPEPPRPGKPEPARAEPPKADAKPEPTDPFDRLASVLDRIDRRSAMSGPAFATPGLNETIEGGKFIVHGKLVNAHRREIDQDGNVLRPETLQPDPFSGKLV